jgi:hypothetical protein
MSWYVLPPVLIILFGGILLFPSYIFGDFLMILQTLEYWRMKTTLKIGFFLYKIKFNNLKLTTNNTTLFVFKAVLWSSNITKSYIKSLIYGSWETKNEKSRQRFFLNKWLFKFK